MNKGKVYLVGAGPGSADLITLRGMARLEKADVVIYDFLAVQLLQHIPEKAERIYVGKKAGKHTVSQDQINQMLVAKANEGKTVVRLKGGDPFVFGRGGEEAEVLAEAAIAFEVVPGVTSGVAAPAFAGIPLTHRRYNTSVAFVTGHEDPTKLHSTIEWSKLATGAGTLVILMGVKNLNLIVERLVAGGRSPQTPAAVVRWGTMPKQVTVVGTLETIADQVEAAGVKPPAVIVVGEVVQLRERLNWFEKSPLFGKTIAVTRTREQAGELAERLCALGAECLECPTIRIVPPKDWSPLDRAMEHLEEYDWIIFTSVNGVSAFFERLDKKGLDVRALHKVRTATIGPATAGRLRRFGFLSDILPQSFRAESIVEAFREESMEGKRILLPRAKEARAILPVELRKLGATVDEITVYETEQVRESAQLLMERLEEGSIDLVTFTSSSTVKNFKALLPEERFSKLTKEVRVAAIGPITAETARALGLTVHIEAKEFTIPGLCDAIVQFYGAKAVL